MVVLAQNCPPIEASKIFLEVGCNYGSVPAHGDYVFSDDEQYIGVNVDRSALERAEADIHRASSLTLPPVFIHGDAQSLPAQIKEGSVDTIYFGNVFGDPGIDAFHIAKLKTLRFADWLERSDSWSSRFEPNAKQEPITPGDFITLPGMLREAHHVIKQAGRLVVVETLTPCMAKHMEAFMENAGFVIDSYIHKIPENAEEWCSQVRLFKRYEAKVQPDIELSEPMPPSYILFASKLAIAKAA